MISLRRLRGPLWVGVVLSPFWLLQNNGVWTELSRLSASIYPSYKSELTSQQNTHISQPQNKTKEKEAQKSQIKGRTNTIPKRNGGAVRNVIREKTTRLKNTDAKKPKEGRPKMEGKMNAKAIVPKEEVVRIVEKNNNISTKPQSNATNEDETIVTEEEGHKVGGGGLNKNVSTVKLKVSVRKHTNATHNTKTTITTNNSNKLKPTSSSDAKEEPPKKRDKMDGGTNDATAATASKGEAVGGVKRNKSNSTTSTKSSNLAKGEKKNKPQQPLDWSRVKDLDFPPGGEAFVRYDKVVVATKVVGPSVTGQLKQMLCLFTAAYNRHVNYDIVVFTTLPWEPENMQEVQAVVPQINLSFVLEGPPLEEQLAAMTSQERDYLYQRCNIHPYGKKKTLSWFDKCTEGDNKALTVKLSYAWQAEFRAFHIWKMPALAPYQYMLWMDTDALCTKPWTTDPMKVMIENDLVLMFDNRAGSTRNPLLLEKLKRVYNRTICDIGLDRNGRFRPQTVCPRGRGQVAIPQVHGFHHITNLDFYRSETNLKFLEILVETHRFSREWDDQLAVTIPPAMEAPERAWDYEHNGIDFRIYHNNRIDGREAVNGPGYHLYWRKTLKHKWDLAREMCDALVIYSGRR